jgi:hypothetical protein
LAPIELALTQSQSAKTKQRTCTESDRLDWHTFDRQNLQNLLHPAENASYFLYTLLLVHVRPYSGWEVARPGRGTPSPSPSSSSSQGKGAGAGIQPPTLDPEQPTEQSAVSLPAVNSETTTPQPPPTPVLPLPQAQAQAALHAHSLMLR